MIIYGINPVLEALRARRVTVLHAYEIPTYAFPEGPVVTVEMTASFHLIESVSNHCVIAVPPASRAAPRRQVRGAGS